MYFSSYSQPKCLRLGILKTIVCLIKMDWFTRALNSIVCYRLREDRAERYERLFKSRRRLEEDWFHALETKKGREAEERLRSRSPGNLLLDQSNPYKRCGQCKRNLNNAGESNIWRESRYIPGSRLVV